MNGKIYMIRNEVNGKRYIGQTVNSLEERFKQHKQGTRQPKKNMTKLQRAMDKYGKPMFTITLIEGNIKTIELLAEREKFFIEKFNTKEEYNSTSGGENRLRTKNIKEGPVISNKLTDNSLVITHNDFNKLSFPEFTSKEIDFLYTLIAANKGSEVVIISFAELFSASGIDYLCKTQNDFGVWFETFVRKTSQVMCPLDILGNKEDGEFSTLSFFEEIKCNFDLGNVNFSVNPCFEYMVQKQKKQYTAFKLGEYKTLTSKYSKLLFRELQQWKKQGSVTFELEELKRLLSVPDSYSRISRLRERVIIPAVNELKERFPGLSFSTNKTKNKVVSYTFSWNFNYFRERQIEEVNEKVQRRVNTAKKRTEKKSVRAMVNDELSQQKEPANNITQEEVDSILSLYFNKNGESFG